MKKLLRIKMVLLSALWLVALALPFNRLTEYCVGFFDAYFHREATFFGFLLSPFPALLMSALASLMTLVSGILGKRNGLGALIANGYFLIQLTIHLVSIRAIDTAAADVSFGTIFYAILLVLYACTIAVYCMLALLRAREEAITQAKIDAAILANAQAAQNGTSPTDPTPQPVETK